MIVDDAGQRRLDGYINVVWDSINIFVNYEGKFNLGGSKTFLTCVFPGVEIFGKVESAILRITSDAKNNCDVQVELKMSKGVHPFIPFVKDDFEKPDCFTKPVYWQLDSDTDKYFGYITPNIAYMVNEAVNGSGLPPCMQNTDIDHCMIVEPGDYISINHQFRSKLYFSIHTPDCYFQFCTRPEFKVFVEVYDRDKDHFRNLSARSVLSMPGAGQYYFSVLQDKPMCSRLEYYYVVNIW